MLKIGTRIKYTYPNNSCEYGTIINIFSDTYEVLCEGSDSLIWCYPEEVEEVYSPKTHGAIEAIRIFMDENGITPMAELAFAYGGTTTICWVDTYERDIYKDGINGYTYIYDERPKREFSGWVKSKSYQEDLQ